MVVVGIGEDHGGQMWFKYELEQNMNMQDLAIIRVKFRKIGMGYTEVRPDVERHSWSLNIC